MNQPQHIKSDELIESTVLGLDNIEKQNTNTKEKLKDYYHDIQVISNLKEFDFVPNEGAYQTSLLMSTMIENTKNHISMVVSRLDGKNSDNKVYIDAFRNFLQRKGKLNIAFTQGINENSKLYQLLDSLKDSGNIKIYDISNNTILDRLKKCFGGQLFHFSVYDTNNYRIEKDISTLKGYGVFRDTDTAEKLLSIFNSITKGQEIN